MGRVSGIVGLLFLMLLFACGGGESGEPAPEGGADSGAMGSGGGAEPEEEVGEEDPALKAEFTKLVEKYYAVQKAGDLDGFFALLSEDLREGLEGQMKFMGENPREALAKSYQEATAGLEFTVVKQMAAWMPEFEGDPLSLLVVKTTANGTEDEVTFWMRKQSGTWLVHSIESKNEKEAYERMMEEGD